MIEQKKIQSDNIHLVAFIDILGFRDQINKYFSGKDYDSLNNLQQALKQAEDFAIKFYTNYLDEYKLRFSFRQFSDCVSISMPIQNQDFSALIIYRVFMDVIRLYQYILLDQGILVRGGISIGGHFENENMIFSEGLVKSYNLESKNAIYPRILVDGQILDSIKIGIENQPEIAHDLYKLFENSIIQDWDGELFVSPFGLLKELNQSISKYNLNEQEEFIDKIYKASDKRLPKLTREQFIEVLSSSDFEKNSMNQILTQIDSFISTNRSIGTEILLKYKWLHEFVTWNLDKNKSKIRFEYYFKNTM